MVPVYNSAPYLPDLLESLDSQAPGNYSLECIFVDDGSTDDSSSILFEWARNTKLNPIIISQQNGGVSRARNRGIEVATGDWICLPDSDDFLGTRYFSSIATALSSHHDGEVSAVSANVVRYDERNYEVHRDHPLAFKFKRGNFLADLHTHPNWIQTQVASGAFRLKTIRENQLSFIEDLHAAEDAIFVANYFLASEKPTLLCVPAAEYFYRRRAAEDSAVDQYQKNPDFYFKRFSAGYLPLLQQSMGRGPVPQWLGNLVLYDLRWFFPREMLVKTKATHLSETEKNEVIDLVSRVLQYIDLDWIKNYQVTSLSVEIRYLLLALKGVDLPVKGSARIIDVGRNRVEIRYLFSGEIVDEKLHSRGNSMTPQFTKIRRLDYFNQTALKERILRIVCEEDETITLTVNHRERPLESDGYSFIEVDLPALQEPESKPHSHTSQRFRNLPRRAMDRLIVEIAFFRPDRFFGTLYFQRAHTLREHRHTRFVRKAAELPINVSKYHDSWVFMDSVRAAGDSGEFLYRYVAKNVPDANSWFVLRKDSPDWQRLEQSGFKLVAYGSTQHKLLLIHAKAVFSSHLDVEIVAPIPTRYYRAEKRPWSFVYLQHGVAQHDLSIWFNTKHIDLLTTASRDEHRALVEDGSSYILTEDSVELTGLPRHDQLLAEVSKNQTRKNILLLAPTWRNELFAPPEAPGIARKLKIPFDSSEYGRQWLSLINSADLHELAVREDLQIIFLPHPNFRGQIPPHLISKNVTMLTRTENLNGLLARSRAVVTDYSSIFFEAAIAGAQISYFQFDSESYLSGAHTQVPGYWSYEEHGFGPVSHTLAEQISVLQEQFGRRSTELDEPFRSRLRNTFPLLDGGSCERILNAARARRII